MSRIGFLLLTFSYKEDEHDESTEGDKRDETGALYSNSM